MDNDVEIERMVDKLLEDQHDNLQITRLQVLKRSYAGGTWVEGRIKNYLFQALIFWDHAENPDFELGDSRISKLWIINSNTGSRVYNWDRGLDVPAKGVDVERVVAKLSSDLHSLVFDR